MITYESEARAPSSGGGRTVVLALCGGADRPLAALGDRTPFEAAPTPHLDALARDGCSGTVDVIGEGVPPESDSGAMALLGYDPLVSYTGRGPLEGHGCGFYDGGDRSVAFRVNFGSWDPASGVLDRRTSRDLSDDELQELVAAVRAGVTPDGATLELLGFGRHRGILAFTAAAAPLSGAVTNTDPGFVPHGPFGVPVAHAGNRPLTCRPREAGDAAAARTAELVNRFVTDSARILEDSPVNAARVRRGRRPANVVLVRDGGSALPDLADFAELTGRSVAVFGQIPAERALAGLIGAAYTVARPDPDESEAEHYRALVPALLAAPADVVYAHVKGPDEPGHDGRPEAKAEAVAVIDEHLIGPLRAALGPADTLVVTCDHATPCDLRLHAADPVPLVVAGPGVPPDAVTAFGERAAAEGALPVHRADQVLGWLLPAPVRSGS